jgi:hypothetical protein
LSATVWTGGKKTSDPNPEDSGEVKSVRGTVKVEYRRMPSKKRVGDHH